MDNKSKKLTLVLWTVTLVCGLTSVTSCTDDDNAQDGGQGTAAEGMNIQEKSQFDSYIDMKTYAGDDFYNYATGTWRSNNPLKEGQHQNGTQSEQEAFSKAFLAKIVQETADGSTQDPLLKQLYTDWNAMTMDAAKQHLKAVLKSIDDVATLEAMTEKMAELVGSGYYFPFGLSVDVHNHIVVPLVKNPMLPSKSQVRLQEISGLTDSEMAQIMATVNKVKPMLPEDDDDDDDDAGNNTNAAHRMLFRCHPHPRATVHSIDNLHRAAGKNLVRDVLAAMNLGDFKSYHSDGVAESGEKLAELQLDELKNVMKYVVMARDADLMPASSAADNDKQRQTAIRWLVKLEASPLVFYLSHLFDKTVSPENREATKKMADEFRTAFRERMEKLTWLTDADKAKALEKLEAMRVVLGWLDTEHPEWLSKTPQSGNFYDDVNELFRQSLEVRKQLIGMQTDDAFMYALSVDFPSYEPNAMYSPVCNMVVVNTINMTAPTYRGDKSDAYNLALLGATIGHEMTHGFDDNGSKFDKTGQEIAWLDAESNANFEKLQQLQIDNFDRLTYWPDYDCNGKRTLTENIADLGGLCIAYDVLMKRLAAQGVTDAERDFQAREFFRAFAFSWMENIDQKQANKYRLQDIHAAGCLRVNGNVYLMDEFYRVFNITKGKMYLSPEKRFLIW